MKTLIVDDELVSREKMKKIMDSLGECVAVESGSEAIIAFKDGVETGAAFDLITLDVSMPEVDGMEVLFRIREIEKENMVPKDKQIKVMMVTSQSDKDTIITCVQAGCNEYIVKPFNKKIINFFSKENWFISMGKAFVPAIIAFSSGLFVAFLIIKIFDFLPEIKYIKGWLKIPNEGIIILLDYIKDANTFKVIIWFFYIIVIIPLFEEIYFRGFLQDSIQKIFKRYNFDIIFTALIFSLFHLFSLSNAIFAFIVGLFLT